ncbi:MAG: VWA domain-containing protein [Planctomycetota bacterium]
MADLPLHFDRPGWLILLLLIVPALFMARRSVGGLSRLKVWATFAVRAVVILMLAAALARPVWEKRGEGLTVTVVLDRSQSIPLAMKQYSLDYLQQAAELKDRPEDRLGVITVARDATIAAMPDRYSMLGADTREPPELDATNLEAAVNLALAVMPQDTANRIVIASDGNETEGRLLAAAELAAANDVPIDVLVLAYEHANEVIFERIAAPSRARLGQTANVKLVLRSQGRASGRVTLKMNDEYLDLNGAEPGTALPVTLDPGLTVVPVSIGLDVAGPVQFEAVFEADDPTQDGVSRNNRAVAVTFVGAEGKILVIDDGGTQSQYLVGALADSELAVEVSGTAALVRGPVFLAAYDAVVLANIPRYAITDEEDRTLHAYVHDLGGGLVMLGGPLSFGAGGWIDSETARVLPIKLDPPQSRQMPRGALALIMHSTEMPQGNFWGQKVAIAAIETLSRLDYVGIIDFDYRSGGCVWEFGPQEAGDKTDAINAAKKMTMGDMPDFARSMKLALNGLSPLPAGQKHVIIISDGDPQGPPQTLLDAFVAANISVTTVLVSGHGTMSDRMMMKAIAEYTGGSFYEVKNPKNLPQIFIKEAQLVSRSLIVEEPGMQPQVVIRLPGPTEGYGAVPAVDGYVLTAPREGHSLIPIVNPTTEGNDPIYAYWNYGLGKAIAYMSDLTGLWGGHWVGWVDFESFWEQSFRWVMRPSAPSNIIVNTAHEGDRAQVEVEALKGDTSFMDFLRTSAVVLHPDGTTEPLTLQQTGPGRYRGDFRTTQEGAYLVNINFVGGAPDAPMQGNIQAAVSVPYPREFRAVKHNAALLKEVADRTGGRELGADPALVDLFYRGELDVPKSPRSIWDLLAILAAALFVLDVAGRRIAVDRRAVAEFMSRAVGRRAEVGTETVAAWKRVAHRRGERSKARFEASEDEAGTTIDVAAEVGQTPKVTGPGRPARDTAEAEAAADEGEYTSRLLAAKRRARDKAQSSGEGEPDA